MQSVKKMKALSVLSMAVAATLGAKAVHGAAILSLYIDNVNVIGTDSQSYGYAAQVAASGSPQNSYTGPTTINVAVGDTFEFGVDAVVTGTTNIDAGKKYGSSTKADITQPSYLGLSSLSIYVPSTDTTASKLSPIQGNGTPPPFQTVSGMPDYNSTASLNNAGGTDTNTGSNNSATPAPNWLAATAGDIWTPPTGPQTAGDVGDRFHIFQGNGSQQNTVSGLGNVAQYGAATGTYATATDFFDSLSYSALTTGTVTLSPQADPGGTSYWENTLAGSATVTPGYIATKFTNAGDAVGSLPILVINITAAPVGSPSQAILSLATSVPTSYGTNEGTATVTGHNGGYKPGYLAVGPDATSYVQVNGFNPGTDEEIYALDVLVNGSQANSSQIALLVNAIDGTDSIAPTSGMLASNTYAGLEALESPTGLGGNPFVPPAGVAFNLFVDTGATGPGSPAYFGFDVSNSNDSNLVGYTISEVAVVPEPMSLGMLALGGLGLLGRRRRSTL
jgi:hypothetical protein